MTAIFKERYLAPKEFYQKVAGIALPLAAQQLLNQGAGFVDTVMVSHVGGVSAVAVASQLSNLLGGTAFGINAGINIYSAQFYGAQDWKSLKKCFGFQLLMNFINFLVFFLAAQLFGQRILHFYSSGDTAIMGPAGSYLGIVCWGYLFTSIIMAYTFMYRAIHKTKIPMYIGIGINLINVVLNSLLIFGYLGLPRMGVAGAALATVIANGCGAAAHIVYAAVTKQPFLGSLRELTDWGTTFLPPIIRRMFPLIANEALFSLGSTMFIKAYSLLGGSALEVYKIGDTVGTFFYIAVLGMNNAAGLLVGEQLGKKDLEGARCTVRYLFPMACVLAVLMASLIALFAAPLVSLFGLTDPAVTAASVTMVRLFAIRIAFRLFNVIFMSTLRAGGDSLFLLFLDCGLLWLVGVPLAFAGVSVFGIRTIGGLFALIQIEQLVRMCIGFARYRQGKWCRNLTGETQKKA
ncbi:MAG: MATE family efflux transporter [Clostridia bacterium]|nr:MATE family efflux transporter [Clostridia bacterium]